MLTLNNAFYSLKNDLQTIYDENEATAVAHELLNHITDQSKFERLLNKEQEFTTRQEDEFKDARERLLNGEPLQYVIGVQWFMGRQFEVNENVLIPRPETEELVEWIANEWKEKGTISILDIGTGSGCIPVSLKLFLPDAVIFSCDISSNALDVAELNAQKHGAGISLLQVDFLDKKTWDSFHQFDVIVSNPPYIPIIEKENLEKNVRDFEPELALFVPENDALIFYRKIAEFAKTHLKEDGMIYCEVHKAHAYETQQLFQQYFSNVELRKDINENERMVKAWNN